MTNPGFFARTLDRLRRSEGGFSLIETTVSLGVLFVAMVALAYTASIGFTDIALARQRQGANQIANKLMEQVRGLSYQTVAVGLKTSDAAADTQNVVSCPDGSYYYRVCPEADPLAEKIVRTDDAPSVVPLVPHTHTFGSPDYPSTYTANVYVTIAKEVPQAGAYRVTAVVNWSNPARAGLGSEVVSQSLLHTPTGTTDSDTGGSGAFFYGAGSLNRASLSITPNAGVTGGTGVTGLGSWDSINEDGYALTANVQQQQLAKAEAQTVMTGARQVVSGVETVAGADTSDAGADNDPATPLGTSNAPAPITQFDVQSSLSGGGNGLEVVAASEGGGGGGPCPTPAIKWLSGLEGGNTSGINSGTNGSEFGGASGGFSADSAVKRTGDYSFKVTASGSAAWGLGFPTTTTDKHTVMHFAIRLDSLPGSDVNELASAQPVVSTSYAAMLGYQASSNRFMVRLRDGAGGLTSPVTSTGTVTAGQWYVIDLYWNSSGTTHTADWKVDGVAQSQATLSGAAATSLYAGFFGTRASGATFTANYDDMALSVTAADFPLPDLRIGRLLPNGMGAGNGNPGTLFRQTSIFGEFALNSNAWQYLDQVPLNDPYSWVFQTGNSTTNYVEITFQDTNESCIVGVRGMAQLYRDGSGAANSRTDVLEGSQTTTIFNGSPLNLSIPPAHYSKMVGTAGAAAWTKDKVNGLISRFGYSSDANPDPYWSGIHLYYAYVPVGGGGEGGAGTETGGAAATTAASAGTPCGSPTQLDGRPCSYAEESYTSANPAFLRTTLDLTGAGAGEALLYKFSPVLGATNESYVWGRRAAGGGGAGTVKETALRYPGAHELGALPEAVGAGPANWPGYWVKYDAGSSAAQVNVEAGIGSAAPSYTSVGTISFWDGDSVETMAPPAAGGTIPVGAVDYTSGGYRVEITGSLATGASYTEQLPVDAVGTADRTEAKAVLGSPVAGEFTYKVTNTATGDVVANLTIAVDLGSLSATARYAAP